MDAKYLKTCLKFVIFYSLPKKLYSIRSISKKLTKKAKIMSQVGVQNLGVPVFFYSSCRTWFIKIIGEEGNGKLSDFYWQSQNRPSADILVIIPFA